MKRTIELISVVAIAMALAIAFSGVAVASSTVPATDETVTIEITTDITCSGTVVESQRLGLEIDSVDLINNTPLDAGEKYGKIGYNEKMIGSSGNTGFTKCFKVDTSNVTSNLDVHKQIGYTQGFLGSLSYHEQVHMNVIAAGEPAETKKCTPKGSTNHSEWKQDVCPFKYPCKDTTVPAVPGSCEEVHVYSEMVVTGVDAETDTKVGIIDTGAPVNLNYKIYAKGTGLVVAGVGVYVEDGRGYETLGSRLMYKEKSIAYGEFEFTKTIGYKSKPPT
jgi:hypothetical protein